MPAPNTSEFDKMRVPKLVCDPEITPFLSREDRDASIVLLNIAPDVEGEARLLLGLDVVFRAIPIRRRSTVGRWTYYLGTSGGRVAVHLERGVICDGFTGPVEISGKYTNSVARKQNTTFQLAASRVEGLPGPSSKLTIGAGSVQTSACEFIAKERVLSPTFLAPNGLSWEISSPRGERAISDAISGNLYLHLPIQPSEGSAVGSVGVCPDSVCCFGPDRRPLGYWKSLAMMLHLLRKGHAIRNADGLDVNFTVDL